MTNPNQVSITVCEPNWAPLERAVPATELENFMYMGCAGEIELYKHRFTRRYLNIGRHSERFYRYPQRRVRRNLSSSGARTRAR